MRNEAYNMDCIEYMRSLPDNVFDIAVCDPPYGKGNDDNLVGGAVRTEIRKVFQTFRGGQEIKTCPHRDASGDGSDATTSRWNRLLGGRRERYYKPADTQVQWRDVGREIQNRGGRKQKLHNGTLLLLRSSSMSFSASAAIR